jgi:hypothetical protein
MKSQQSGIVSDAQLFKRFLKRPNDLNQRCIGRSKGHRTSPYVAKRTVFVSLAGIFSSAWPCVVLFCHAGYGGVRCWRPRARPKFLFQFYTRAAV